MGENLFKQGFAQMVAKGDAKTGGILLRGLDKLRRAVGIKNSPSTGDIAMLERLVMQVVHITYPSLYIIWKMWSTT